MTSFNFSYLYLGVEVELLGHVVTVFSFFFFFKRSYRFFLKILPEISMYTLLHIFIDMYTLLYLGCARSLLLHLGFLQLQSMGSRHMGFSGCGTGAHYLWLEGLVALQHVESSQTRDRTCVPCVGRRILTHSATREVLCFLRN